MRLQGKTALVTAAGQGIGRASVLAMAAEGAQVIATDLNPQLLKAFEGVANVRTAVLHFVAAVNVPYFTTGEGSTFYFIKPDSS